ncbi:MAG: hypothetical protein WCF24_01065 [Acidimicrobiales bacterium]
MGAPLFPAALEGNVLGVDDPMLATPEGEAPPQAANKSPTEPSTKKADKARRRRWWRPTCICAIRRRLVFVPLMSTRLPLYAGGGCIAVTGTATSPESLLEARLTSPRVRSL